MFVKIIQPLFYAARAYRAKYRRSIWRCLRRIALWFMMWLMVWVRSRCSQRCMSHAKTCTAGSITLTATAIIQLPVMAKTMTAAIEMCRA